MTRHLTILIGLMAVFLFVVACGDKAVVPDSRGTIIITQGEFNFVPSNIEFRAGQKVRIVLKNGGEEDHEFMVGRTVVSPEGFPNGFKEEFFKGVDVTVSGPAKIVMAGDANLTRVGGKEGRGGDGDGG